MEANLSVTTLTCACSSLDKTMKIIPDDVDVHLRTAFSIVLTILVSTLGVTANILNILVYYKQGFRNSVNITFMILSVWDLTLCFSCKVIAVCILIEEYFPLHFSLQPIEYVYVAYSRALVYILSTIVTVCLSMERCFCVMFPLRIKEMFTTRRILLVNSSMVVFSVASLCPAWATQGIQWVFSPTDNITRLVLWVSDNRRDTDLFVEPFNGMVLPIVSQVLITVSSVFMIHGINKSSKFRKKVTNLGRSETTYNSKKKSNIIGSNFNKGMNTMTNKDIKLTKVIVFLASIFFACNLPLVFIIFVRVMFPEVNQGKPQQNLYDLLYVLVFVCILIKSGANIFVYYFASSRYRQAFLSLFGRI